MKNLVKLKKTVLIPFTIITLGTAPINYNTGIASLNPASNVNIRQVQIKNVSHLQEIFASHKYDLSNKQACLVPRLVCENIPDDIKHITCVKTKKSLFMQVLLPVVLCVNEGIVKDRNKLLKIAAVVNQGGKVTQQQQEWINALAKKYRMKKVDVNELVTRVDTIPPSLALGQAIVETGWGYSYAARVRRSLFGMLNGQDVKDYDNIYECVRGYMHNLNTNFAYREMRAARVKMRQGGQAPNGHVLIGEMVRYSEQREMYIEKVRTAIRQNDLVTLDQAKLKGQLSTLTA